MQYLPLQVFRVITHAPVSKDVASLPSFLGMLSWHGKFIPNWATVVEPLHTYLHQDALFEWTDEAHHCFLPVKRLLVDSSALALFNPELRTNILTDTSDYELGAVFTQ